MKEPSVLDYVKSKLAFWLHTSIEIPPLEQDQNLRDGVGIEEVSLVDGPALAGGGSAAEADAPLAAAAVPQAPAVRANVSAAGAMLSLSALILALIAQSAMEPPSRFWVLGVFFYAVAAVLVGIAFYKGYLRLAAGPKSLAVSDGLDAQGLVVNVIPLFAGLLLMLVTFLAFGKLEGLDVPRFNLFNTPIWLLSIFLIARGFYAPGSANGLARLRERTIALLRKPGWRIHLTRWTVVLLVVIGVVLFFRFYRLDTLPNEAVSDQTEKLLDVYDVLNGELRVFFPRNTGREPFQFYWTALIIKLFDTGVTFFSLKLGTVLIGLLTLYYIYRLGQETGNRWVALAALLFCGFSYWAQTQSRVGLRFALYPGFYAPLLYYLIRGLRNYSRNDFIWAGIWLGIGLNGYTAYRIVPFIVVAAFAIYILHNHSPRSRDFALWGLVILALVALAVFMPLFRYSLDDWNSFATRSWSRLGTGERDLPGSPLAIFLLNLWKALTMFFWDDGEVWVHAVPHRPALDVISAALFFLGLVLLALRYLQKRGWMDLFMLVSIPMLLLPSILSLAFPNENPNLNRTAAAYIPAFLIMAFGLEAVLNALKRGLSGRWATAAPLLFGVALALLSARANYDLVFNQYNQALRLGTWDSTEMGEVVRQFDQTFGRNENAWVVAYPYWVDTRLVGINSGYPTRDMSIFPENLPATVEMPGNKLFILSPEDASGLATLQALYPEGRYWLRQSEYPGKDFFIFMVLSPDWVPVGGVDGLLPAGVMTGEQAPSAAE